MNNEKARIEWIDLVRAVAILLVVLCHSTESIYQLNLEYMTAVPFQSRVCGFACFTAGRLGVPLFLMITGSLLLSRDYDSDSIKYFWKNKWLHLLICTLFWFVIYDVFLVLNNHAAISFLQLTEDLLFLRRLNMSHVWYLPTILGLYILLPFVSSVLKKYDNRLFLFPMLIYTAYALGYNTLNVVYRVYHPELPLANQLSLGFSGTYYGIYILYGYFISTGTFKKIPPLCIIIISLLAFVSVVFIQNWSYENGIVYNVWYNDLLILAASMGIFELASRIKHVYGYKVIREISKYSFAVYLTHNIFRMVLADSVNALAMGRMLKAALLWAVCSAAGFVLSVLISTIPKLGKYILYMK